MAFRDDEGGPPVQPPLPQVKHTSPPPRHRRDRRRTDRQPLLRRRRACMAWIVKEFGLPWAVVLSLVSDGFLILVAFMVDAAVQWVLKHIDPEALQTWLWSALHMLGGVVFLVAMAILAGANIRQLWHRAHDDEGERK